jgi:hypothetical protein
MASLSVLAEAQSEGRTLNFAEQIENNICRYKFTFCIGKIVFAQPNVACESAVKFDPLNRPSIFRSSYS